MDPIFQITHGFSAEDKQYAKSLLEVMLVEGEVLSGTHPPIYQDFYLPDSGLHVTPRWYLDEDGRTEQVVLITTVFDGRVYSVASLRYASVDATLRDVAPKTLYTLLKFWFAWLVAKFHWLMSLRQ